MSESLRSWVHLAVLWSFAIAQPLFGVLADSPEFFVARGNTALDIVVLALALILGPPTLLLGLEALASLLGSRARRAVHLLIVALLVAALALQLLDAALGSSAALLIPASLLLGAAAAVVYERTTFLRSLLTALGPAPAVFVLLFLFVSPVSDLVLPGDDAEARAGVAGRPAPVVMVVFDELSVASLMDERGRIDSRRNPNFARFARAATWYRNATTVDDMTPQAVPSILTGTLPRAGRLPVAADYPRSLFSMLGDGYDLHVTEPVTDICADALCGAEADGSQAGRLGSLATDLSVVSLHVLLPEDLRDGLPSVDQSFEDFRDGGGDAAVDELLSFARRNEHEAALDERTGQFQDFVREIEPQEGRPPLHLLHVALPHIPWQYLPSGQRYALDSGLPPGLGLSNAWSGNRELARQGLQRYLLQLGFADRLLGGLLRRLRETSMYDKSLVVVTADHGVSFEPGGSRRGVSRDNVGAIAGVPLLIKAPGQGAGGIDDSGARTIDVLPTIADHLEIKLPWKFDGRSLRGSWSGSGRVSVRHFSEGGVQISLDAYRRRRDAEVTRIARSFGAGLAGLYRRPGDERLVGRRLAELSPAGQGGARVELDGAGALVAADGGAEVVPARLTGTLSGLGAGHQLAVAVNGVVRGTTESYEDGDRIRLSVMVPPESFGSGRNSVEVLAVEGPPSAPRLTRLGGTGPAERYRLAARGESEVVVAPSGRAITVAPGRAGYLEKATPAGGDLTLAGWSATAAGPARTVVAFRDGRFLGAARPSRRRPDVAASLGRGARLAGFTLVVPAAPGGPPERGLRLFGLIGERAHPVPRLGAAAD